jgi:prephenate dehydrogenase
MAIIELPSSSVFIRVHLWLIFLLCVLAVDSLAERFAPLARPPAIGHHPAMALQRVVIIGVGLIGGSVALAVRRAHPDCEVTGVGRTGDDVAAMTALGVVHNGTTDLRVAAGADLVVIATPVGTAASVLDRLAGIDAVVTDVLSTKRPIVRAAAERGVRFVGSHPMGGSDRRGIEHARADLLAGSLCLVTPTDRTDRAALAFVEQFWTSIGLRPMRMTPEEHDRLVAAASHVPHATAAALVAIQSAASLAVTAGGFRDATRIAAGDPDLWRDILLDNRDFVAGELVRVRGELDRLIQRLDGNDAEGVRAWLAAAAAKRAGMAGGCDPG